MGIRTRGRRRKLWVLVGALVMAFIIGPATVAVGQAPAQSAVIDHGVLVLELGAVDHLRHVAPDGSTIATQAIATQGCKVTLDTSGDVLATIAPTDAGTVGLFADGLGVKGSGEKGGNGQPCGQANGVDEGLVLKLAGSLAGLEIDLAELDIEGKFNVMVDFDLYRDGAMVASGASLGTGDLSDSGPDSGDGDNYRHDPTEGLADDVTFDEVRMTVSPSTPSGAFSLEGGADGTAPGSLGFAGSAFRLVEVFDGVIDCGESTLTAGDGASTPEATFTRADDDAKNEDPCSALIGYNLDSTIGSADQKVLFEFQTEEAPHWFGTITWVPEPAVVPVPATDLDLDLDGNADGVLDWCDGFSGVDGATGNPLPIMPSGESWCLIDQSSTLLGDGTMQVVQTIYGESDPGFARPK